MCIWRGDLQVNSNLTVAICHFFQTLPFFGVLPSVLNEHGEELEGEAEGYLVRV